mmetsp:Transcript_18886/g.48692  ORF Transcript_18886/g.48692 Transcript_18886/m.48692 type:complete len:90 (-) Transcript_18886:510-779(-)
MGEGAGVRVLHDATTAGQPRGGAMRSAHGCGAWLPRDVRGGQQPTLPPPYPYPHPHKHALGQTRVACPRARARTQRTGLTRPSMMAHAA